MDGIHLKIAPPQIKTWSMSINKGTASLEVPPDGLTANFAPSKAGTYNPLRPGIPTKRAKSDLPPESSFSPALTPFSAIPPFSKYPTYPPYFYNPYTPSPTQMQQTIQSTNGQTAYRTQFSDSIIDDQDPLEKLVEDFQLVS
jgi:hypothetical protein